MENRIYELWEKYSSDAAFETYMNFNSFRRALLEFIEVEKKLLINDIIKEIEAKQYAKN